MGNTQYTQVQSAAAAAAYKAANPGIGACFFLDGWPQFSMVEPDNSTTLPVKGGLGTTGEPANRTHVPA